MFLRDARQTSTRWTHFGTNRFVTNEAQAPRARFVGKLEREGEQIFVRSLLGEAPAIPWRGETAKLGSIVDATRTEEGFARGEVLAKAGSARAELYLIAASQGLDPLYPPEVEREVEAILRAPGIDDAALRDLTELPFVTIDGAYSRDLDQALCVLRRGEGYTVYYALADAAHFVQQDSALFKEALARGASIYLPGFSIPMLPRALSEGLVSLNPDVLRRSLVFVMELDASGRCERTEVVRARVKSRAKLSFEQVQTFSEAPTQGPLSGREFSESLLLLREVGRKLMAAAEARGVVRYRRQELEVQLEGEEGLEFVVLVGVRDEVELWNEQLSLLCNREGAKLLIEHPAPHVQPIFRVHPAPGSERLEGFCGWLQALVKAQQLDPAKWLWRDRDGVVPLAQYLSSLPTEGREGRIASAVHRHAILANLRSTYTAEAAKHHGVGAEAYARFSAPMREVVGIFVHKETCELLAGKALTSPEEDLRLRDLVVEAGNRSKATQRKVTDLANRLVLDRIFERDLRLPWNDRTQRKATVLGVGESKVHVQFDAPAIDVKLYTQDLERAFGRTMSLTNGGVSLVCERSGKVLVRVGDELSLKVRGRDEKRDRWILWPV